MKKQLIKMLAVTALLASSNTCFAQFNLGRAIEGAGKAVTAFTLTDQQMADYVQETVVKLDQNNQVLPDNSPYTQRLNRLVEGIADADGIPLNFKVYNVTDVNAFACPDGSVRVFSALMDIMDDDELMGIIGHEIGHVLKRHSKKQFKNQLLGDALKDAIASSSAQAAALTDSQLAALGDALINAKYSQKQEKEADDCGYEFLVKNGRNPWGMVMAFKKFQNLEGNQQNSYLTKMFSSHPDTKSRIERMTKRCNKDGFPPLAPASN